MSITNVIILGMIGANIFACLLCLATGAYVHAALNGAAAIFNTLIVVLDERYWRGE